MFLLAVRGGNDPAVIFEGTDEALVARFPAMEPDVARWEEELGQALLLSDDDEGDAWVDRPVLVRMDHEPAWPAGPASEAKPAGAAPEDAPSPFSTPGLSPVVVFAGESVPFAWLAWLVEDMPAARSGPACWRPMVWAFRSEAHMLEVQPEAGVNGAARREWFRRAGAWGARQRTGACDLSSLGEEPIVVRGAFGHALTLLAARIGEGFE
jgi:hypothetical protein